MLRFVAALTLLVSTGCIGVVPRNHAAGLVDELGHDAASKELKEVSTRAHDPQIIDVEFTDVGFTYTYNSVVHMGWVGPSQVQNKNAIVFNNLSRLDIYENNKVFIYTGGDRQQGAILFGSMSDAERWCDLVTSLKAEFLASGG